MVVERYAYDPWGKRRNPTNWTQDDPRTSWIVSRGYTMHEHLDAFGIINMNGRVYDPLTAMFFSPDPFVQAPGNWLNYNRYGYCHNNPLIYTDPSGELIWIIPNIGWSKSGGLSIGISVVVGIPGGLSAQAGIGYSFGSNDAYGYVGVTAAMNTIYASYSLNSGGSVGYTAGLSPFSGLPISTNFGTVGVNYNISHNSWSGNVSAWQVDQSGWTFNPSVSVMLFPEQTTNLVRGGKFINNDAMLKTFKDAGNYQGALDYFGFKGTYDPGNEIFNGGSDPGAVDPKTGEIYFNSTAFNSTFDKLYFVADHEGRHSADVRSGKYDNLTLTKEMMAGEEFNTWAYNYRRQGLYRKHGFDDIGDRLNSYGTVAGINPDIIFSYSYYQPKWHVIYRIPRRW